MITWVFSELIQILLSKRQYAPMWYFCQELPYNVNNRQMVINLIKKLTLLRSFCRKLKYYFQGFKISLPGSTSNLSFSGKSGKKPKNKFSLLLSPARAQTLCSKLLNFTKTEIISPNLSKTTKLFILSFQKNLQKTFSKTMIF